MRRTQNRAHTLPQASWQNRSHFAEFYDISKLLVLGRVSSGEGGEIIIEEARKVLDVEFPELAERIEFRVPDEKFKRHGQAVIAASLPEIKK